MKFYKIDCDGPLLLEYDPGLPSWTADDEGRLIYEALNGQVHYGNYADWIRLFDATGDMIPDTPNTYKIGDTGSEWGEVHFQNGNITGLVTMHGSSVLSVVKMVGNIYDATQTNMILENGTDWSAWFKGDIRTDDGDMVLYNGGNIPGNATFSGTAALATAAKYS